MSLKNELQELANKEVYRLAASKFIEKFDAVKNNKTDSRRRWVWELIQNAKDARKEDGVIIDIQVDERGLTFRHNGDPFDAEQLSGLMKQISSKPSDNSQEGITGKYGTGFITTYLLSPKIEVQGVASPTEGAPTRFRIELDRTDENAEKLAPVIEREWKQVVEDSGDDNRLVPIPDYHKNRQDNDLDTSFFYPIAEADLEEIEADLKKLSATAPLALVFNAKIKQIAWINHASGHGEEYSRQAEPRELGPYHEIKVAVKQRFGEEIIESTTSYLLARFEAFSLATGFERLGDGIGLVLPGPQTPYLFRDFPLIGSEDFTFPFVLNSSQMHPEERRDSIFLNGDGAKPTRNREILKSAMQGCLELAVWLSNQSAEHLYFLARMGDADPRWDVMAQDWYRKEVLNPYRLGLIELAIVKTEDGFAQLKSIWVPKVYAAAAPALAADFWEISNSNLGKAIVPIYADWENWYDSMRLGHEPVWAETPMCYTLDKLMGDIAEAKSLAGLELEDRDDDHIGAWEIAWLNRVYDFAYAVLGTGPKSDMAVIPNMKGQFAPLHRLWVEQAGHHIPEVLLNLLEQLDQDWRGMLMHRDVRLHGLEGHQTLDIEAASKQVSGVLDQHIVEGSTKKYKFLSRPNCIEICLQILCLAKRHLELGRLQDFFIEKGPALFKIELASEPTSPIDGFDATIAIEHLIRLANAKIEGLGGIQELAAHLDFSEDHTVIWLDGYLRAMYESNKMDFSPRMIVPNRKGRFCRYSELYDFGKPDEPLDEQLVDVLGLLNPAKDWWKILIGDGIGISCGKEKTREELHGEIPTSLSAVLESRDIEPAREGLLKMAKWYQSKKEPNKIINGINTIVTNMFFKLAMDEQNKDNVLAILAKPEQLASLAKISASGLDIERLEKITEIISAEEMGLLEAALKDHGKKATILSLLNDPNMQKWGSIIESGKWSAETADEIITLFPNGLPEEVLEIGKKKREAKENFDFLSKLGGKMEKLLMDTLNETVPHLNPDWIGKGPFDICLTSPRSGKKFFLELKSVKPGNVNPVQMTFSQARLAVDQGAAFALLVIERGKSPDDMDTDSIRNELMCLIDPGGIIENRFQTVNQFRQELEKEDPVVFDLHVGEPKVGISYNFVKGKKVSYDELIKQILSIIGS